VKGGRQRGKAAAKGDGRSDAAKAAPAAGDGAIVLPARAGPIVLASALFVLASAPPLLARVLYAEAFVTGGPSMEPTLLDGDRFAIDRTAVGLFFPWEAEARASWAVPEVGDVVVVRSPLDEVDIVKRVIGLPGDRIEIQGDEVFRNGVSLGRDPVEDCRFEEAFGEPVCVEEHAGARAWRTLRDAADAASMDERTIPEGHVFVLGDHRNRSNDSRRIGPIPLSRVIGVARYRYYSPAGQPVGEIE
jgi:signal peptidase I